MKSIFTGLLLAFTAFAAQAQYENTKIQVGQPAPDLAYSNPKGDTLKLSEIGKKRVVLIDYWASWCRPCRMANPRLVKLYNEYKDKKFKNAKKGFTVLSVSLDRSKDDWIAAIAKDSLSWEYHISDLGYWNSKAAEQYGVQFVPQAFLVADGKIVGKYANAEAAEEDLKKLLKGYKEPKNN
jgi:thiol-disulfide isomerase/thioredoxin